METPKKETIKAFSKLPDSAGIDEIMYEIYVIDRIRKGKQAAERGDTVTIEDLKRGMQSWRDGLFQPGKT